MDEKLKNLTPKEIISKIESGELRLGYRDIDEIALGFEKDEDKIAILKHTLGKIKIIRTLKNEESILKALKELKSDEEKVKATKFIKDESNKIKAIETLEDKSKAFDIKVSLSREGFKKFFLKDVEQTYDKIGIDKDITFGLEIESIGEKSEDILTIGKNNGIKIDPKKDIECGTMLIRKNDDKQRSWISMPDGSLVMGAGLEMVSPILTDNEIDIEDIYMVCNMLQECGQEIGNCCGGHVHIGSDYLTTKESYVNFLEIYGNTERILFILSNEKGSIPRRDVRKTCITYFEIYRRSN